MKVRFTILICILIVALKTNAQIIKENIVSVHVGHGTSNENIPSSSFEVGFTKHLLSGLYGTISYSKISGSRSFTDLIEGTKIVNQWNEIGSHVTIDVTNQWKDSDINFKSTPGSIITIDSYAAGIGKYIRMGEKLLIRGAISASFSSVDFQYLDGISFNTENVLIEEELYPVYESFTSLGAKVDLAVQYFIADHVSLELSAKYNSNPQVIMLQVGASAWF